nr:hypothetical protein 5 [bacterium]
MQTKILEKMADAEAKAIDALARYKFYMFGYWSAAWIKYNQLLEDPRPNPFKDLVKCARKLKAGDPVFSSKTIATFEGTARWCSRCREYWPATTEFFYKRGKGLHNYCKACCAERSRELIDGAPRIHERRSSA